MDILPSIDLLYGFFISNLYMALFCYLKLPEGTSILGCYTIDIDETILRELQATGYYYGCNYEIKTHQLDSIGIFWAL